MGCKPVLGGRGATCKEDGAGCSADLLTDANPLVIGSRVSPPALPALGKWGHRTQELPIVVSWEHCHCFIATSGQVGAWNGFHR